MRILVLSQYWAPENGVPQRRWSWLAKILVQAGHEVLVIAPPPHYQRRLGLKQWFSRKNILGANELETGNSGEKILRSGFFPAGPSLTHRILNQASVAASMLFMQVTKRKRLKDFKPDLVIGTVPALPTAVITQFVAKILHTPYIIDLRDAWPELLKEKGDWNSGTGKRSIREIVLTKGPFQLLTAVTEHAMNHALHHADGIMTTSQDLTEHLEQDDVIRGVAGARRIRTVRNVFPPKTKFLASDKGQQSSKELKVLYAGTVGRAQKIDNAVKAVKIAQDRGYDINLRIVGDGATWHATRATIESLGINATIEHRVPADELQSIYEWSDTALVHLTDWEPLNRTVPSKTYELMSLGVHTTAVVQGEAARLIEELGAGVVVPPENPEALAAAWAALIDDRSKLTVSPSGREWVVTQRDKVVPEAFLDIVYAVNNQHEKP
ncbi:glycosyltransferase family 4 protein [Corynebacterium aurimucosum]|uniref:glycosyltransferase family 4 protein n=1 Tax=Corynebacterium aurimucosum TaxID=169292 RepID=UPI000C8025F2|nr:glycosyltransferase family 4 protein [Corynebacterium aurimucosum]PMC71992.1 glycosyltransferase WbuB [Corynebacterium aurimucosum]